MAAPVQLASQILNNSRNGTPNVYAGCAAEAAEGEFPTLLPPDHQGTFLWCERSVDYR